MVPTHDMQQSLLDVTGSCSYESAPCSCGFNLVDSYFISEMHCLAASVRDVVLITCCIQTGIGTCPDRPQDIHTRGLPLNEETQY
jgi:hypothetical protein